MKFRLVTKISIVFFLQGCVGLNVASVHKEDVVGRDVDVVISDLVRKGIECGKKFTEKAINSSRISGSMNCSMKERALMCTKSYGIYLSYDLATNKVTSLFEDERNNCF